MAVLALSVAWLAHGSIAAADWLPYAVAIALLLAVLLVFGAVAAPPRAALLGVGGLVALAAWTALSLRWSPSPSLARDEALLTALYAVAVLVPVLTLRGRLDRFAAVAAVALILGGLAVATAIRLWTANDPSGLFLDGRLDFPISYPNAAAALFLGGFWPGIAVAAMRPAPLLLRVGGLAAATGTLSCWALAQSKGGGIGLVISAAVLLLVVRNRLRLLVPTALVAAVVAVAFRTLTAPYRAQDTSRFAGSIQHAGKATLLAIAVGGLLGLAYALLDRRREVGEHTVRVAGRALALLGIALVVAGLAVFITRVHHPGRFAHQKWEHFKTLPVQQVGSSHLGSLGSNRYDFWRVGLHEWERHPAFGIGGRGFGSRYLIERRSTETPQRAHSIEIDTLSETGLVGIALLALGLLPLLVAAARNAGHDLAAAGGLGAGVGWLAHASVDWVWTFPAATVPVLAVLGAGAARGRGGALPRRLSLLGAGVAAAVALLAFAPPWLSSRYTQRAVRESSTTSASADLRRARRLDPLATEPWIAASELAPDAAGAVPPLERAVRMEPRSSALHYLLGLAEATAGNRARARAELQRAKELDPHDDLIAAALARLHG